MAEEKNALGFCLAHLACAYIILESGNRSLDIRGEGRLNRSVGVGAPEKEHDCGHQKQNFGDTHKRPPCLGSNKMFLAFRCLLKDAECRILPPGSERQGQYHE